MKAGEHKNKAMMAIGGVLIASALVVALFILRGSSAQRPEEAGTTLFLCDAEDTTQVDGKTFFKGKNNLIPHGELWSDEISYSGNSSCRTDKLNPFGFSAEFAVNAGELYRATVWRFNIHGAGKLVASGDWKFFYASGDGIDSQGDGWDKLEVVIQIPDSVQTGMLKFYVLNSLKWDEAIFFDDFRIEKLAKPLPVCTPERKDSLAQIYEYGHHIRPHRKKGDNGQDEVEIVSFYPKEVKIVGVAPNRIAPMTPLEEPVTMPVRGKKEEAKVKQISIDPLMAFVCVQIPGSDSIYREPIMAWSYPEGNSPRQKLFKNIDLSEHDCLEVKGDSILFKPGNFEINERIIIPQGFVVAFPPACSLNFVDDGGFISLSKVLMKGTPASPILIESTDSSATGFTVLNAPDTCRLSNVYFRALDRFKYKEWGLTGAVTFHECNVEINAVSVMGNVCEDALNLVRSNFEIEQLTIGYTYSDGFDADFCTGTIRNSLFTHTGNDGMDFSGSHITVSGCTVENAGDKGLSVGEWAYVQAVNGNIVTGSPIGFASKDKSELTVDNATIKNCQIGFAAYQKKPEFGPGLIFATNITATDNEANYKLGNGSVLKWDGEQIK